MTLLAALTGLRTNNLVGLAAPLTMQQEIAVVKEGVKPRADACQIAGTSRLQVECCDGAAMRTFAKRGSARNPSIACSCMVATAAMRR